MAKTFSVTLWEHASQMIDVEADDYEDAIEKAIRIGMDLPNIHNKFEFGGEEHVGPVYHTTDGDFTCVYEGDNENA